MDEIGDAIKYLGPKGIGLFGLILARTPLNNPAKKLQITKWVTEQKLVVLLKDDDLLEMLQMYSQNQEPCEVIQRKIDEFMLEVEE